MPQSAISTTDPTPVPLTGEASFTRSCHGLLELFLAVSDGRSDQGRDHPVAVVLALVAAATVAGLKGYTAMSGWLADIPTDILDSLYTRVDARPVGRPSRSTLWRVCTDTDADVLDAVIAQWTATQRAGSPEQAPTSTGMPMQVRLDGKTVRGAIDTDGEQLLATDIRRTSDVRPTDRRPGRYRPGIRLDHAAPDDGGQGRPRPDCRSRCHGSVRCGLRWHAERAASDARDGAGAGDGHPQSTPSEQPGADRRGHWSAAAPARSACRRPDPDRSGNETPPKVPRSTAPRRPNAPVLSIDSAPVAGRCATFAGAGRAEAVADRVIRRAEDLLLSRDRAGRDVPVVRPQRRAGNRARTGGEPYQVGIARANERTTRAIFEKQYSGGVPILPDGMRIVDEAAVVRSTDTRACQS